MSNFELFARSDVARDIEQNSAYFTSVGKSVYEYVSNSVDYCKPGARVEVHVTRSRGKLTVRKHRTLKYSGIVVEETKNGGGMSRETLGRFFTMHAETLARKEGRRVRGRFGTGKAAAFGIGKSLIVDTVKDRRRNVVRLDFEDLKPGLDKVPIQSLLTEQDVNRPDGTTVIIDRLKLRRVKMESAKRFLRRSLGLQLRNHDIFVQGEKLEYSLPEYERHWPVPCPEEQKAFLGHCTLTLRLAKKELEEEEQGVVILSGGYPMEFYPLTKAGSWSSRLFGEVDVPLLDSPDEIPPFDNTRSRLNRDNERVSGLLGWIECATSDVVSELEKEARAKVDKEEARRLKKTAEELEDILNEDFSQVMNELESTPAVGGAGNVESGVHEGESGAATLIEDEGGATGVVRDDKGNIIVQEPSGGHGHGQEPNPDDPHRGRRSEGGSKARETVASGEKRRPRGGFKIDYAHEGPDAFRAKWVREEMTIKLNLDYPELAIFTDREDPRFKAISGEIAISEYAIATVNLEVQHGYVDVADNASDALIEYKRIINRLGRKMAPLMERWFESSPKTS